MSHWQSALICANLITLFCVSAQTYLRNESNRFDEKKNLLPAYAIASTAHLLVNSTTCRKEMQDFQDAIDQHILWSLKILDSSGEPKSGFLYGNNYWLGSRKQCSDSMNIISYPLSKQNIINNTLYRKSQEEVPPFEVNYFVAKFKHNSTLQYHIDIVNEDIIILGLCLPASCTTDDLSFILEKIFHDRTLLIGDIYSADFALIEVKNLKYNYKWLMNSSSLIICTVLFFTCVMMIIGTIYDIFVYKKNVSIKKRNISRGNEETKFSLISNKKNIIREVLMCFSVYTNTKIIFNTKLSANTIYNIHGMRLLNMIWIIMVHTVIFTSSYIDNKIMIWKESEKLFNQIFANASLSVDTYFFQSGFLMTYLYLKKTMTQTNTTNYRKLNIFFVMVIKRYIRITPVYMMTLGIVLLTLNDEFSEFYVNENFQEICSKYWWRNLLYINNLYDYNNMCLSWSWYISNDMQFFIIGTALLILSSSFFYTSVVILGILLIGSIVLTGYISYIHAFIPLATEIFKNFNILYNPPWIRIGPYIIGMIAAYILIRLNNKLKKMKRRIVILCWFFGSMCNIFTLFGLYKQPTSILFTTFYVALYRVVWAIGIAWIVIACCTKHAGIINKLLSFKGWIPFSNLTYCTYFLNPYIILSIYLYNEVSFHTNWASLIIMFLGNTMIIFTCAYILSLMAEKPYIRLWEKFTNLQSDNEKKQEMQEI